MSCNAGARAGGAWRWEEEQGCGGSSAPGSATPTLDPRLVCRRRGRLTVGAALRHRFFVIPEF